MSLWDGIRGLPKRLRARFESPSDKVSLQEAVNAGAEVLSVFNTPGMDVIRREAAAIEAAMLEAVASVEVTDWAEYVELRGRLTGFRHKHDLPNLIIKAGAAAESELQKQSHKGERRSAG